MEGKLPEEYQDFLLEIGSGGAGPYYGLEKPENCIYLVMDYDDELNAISEPFPHVESWNWDVDWYELWLDRSINELNEEE